MILHGHHVQPYEIPAVIAAALLALEVFSDAPVRRFVLFAALVVTAILFVAGCALCSVGPDHTAGLALGQARCGIFAAPDRVDATMTTASPEPIHTPDRLAQGIEGGGLTPTGYEAIGAGIAAVVSIVTALVSHGVL